MSLPRLILCCYALFLVTGCGPKTRYVWTDYDNKLYQHYKNPAELDLFIQDLKTVMEAGEAAGLVPPGIYAEYGFALCEKGSFAEAGKYFQLESAKWPESRVLMAKMTQYAQATGKRGKPANDAVSGNSAGKPANEAGSGNSTGKPANEAASGSSASDKTTETKGGSK